MDYSTTATKERIEKAIAALKENGIDASYHETRDEAIQKVFELIPEGAEVMTMTSETLNTLGIPKTINESGKYDSVRVKLANKEIPAKEKRRLGAAPDYAIGSAHAVTEDGKVFIAS